MYEYSHESNQQRKYDKEKRGRVIFKVLTCSTGYFSVFGDRSGLTSVNRIRTEFGKWRKTEAARGSSSEVWCLFLNPFRVVIILHTAMSVHQTKSAEMYPWYGATVKRIADQYCVEPKESVWFYMFWPLEHLWHFWHRCLFSWQKLLKIFRNIDPGRLRSTSRRITRRRRTEARMM